MASATQSQTNGMQMPAAPVNTQSAAQQIMDTASKRISTLDYLRKTHESRTYYFNTLLLSRPDLMKLPTYSTPSRMGRRAQHLLLLGFSLPMLADLHAHSLSEYLRALSVLFSEFDSYAALDHATSSGSSLGRARMAHMFKRPGKRTTEFAPSGGTTPPVPPPSSGGLDKESSNGSYSNLPGLVGSPTLAGGAMVSSHHGASLGMAAEPLLPNEHYTHLLTPPLPFEPDLFETFATLCDVLMDAYAKIATLAGEIDASGPEREARIDWDLFSKADAKVKKVIINGFLKESEDKVREGVKGEIAGIGKVVLGGLM